MFESNKKIMKNKIQRYLQNLKVLIQGISDYLKIAMTKILFIEENIFIIKKHSNTLRMQ